jgi:prevent-host-death family protein
MKSMSSRSSRNRTLAHGSRKEVNPMTTVPLSEVKDDLSRYLRLAETEDIVITRHGKPAGVLIGFESEDDWIECRLENDPKFQRRIETARRSLQAGHGVRLEDVES